MRRIALAMGVTLLATSTVAAQRTRADSVAARAGLAGTWAMTGVREAAAELVLHANGRFEWGLAYGALDEVGAGTWTAVPGGVRLQSDGVARRFGARLQSASGTPRDSFALVVTDSAGRPFPNLDVEFHFAGGHRERLRTTTERFVVEPIPADAVLSHVVIGVAMLDAMDTLRIAAADGRKRQFRLVFDPGDLGRRRFEGVVFTRDGDALLWPGPDGRPVRFVRARR